MPNLALHTAIQELLIRDNFAGIPGLGGFLLKPADPTVNAYTKELKPTHSHLVFNAQLKDNDGQLAHLVSISQGIRYKEAMVQIDLVVSELKNQLNNKRYATFFPFGNFFQNENKGIFFVARQQFNLHLPNYGLQPLKWESQKQQKTSASYDTSTSKFIASSALESEEKPVEEALVIGVSDEQIQNAETKQSTNIWWTVAASFAIISVSALTLTIATMTWFGAYNERQAYASMVPNSSTIENSSTESNSKTTLPSDFVYVNGKLIKIKSVETNNSLGSTSNKGNNESNSITKNIESEINLLDPQVYLNHLLDQKGTIFLVGGSYITKKAADIECKQWIGAGNPATILKPSNSSFYRIILGRFQSKEQAQEYSVNIKTIPSASISMTRWNLR